MAAITLKDAHITINSVDLSDKIQTISVELSQDLPQSTAMGDDAHEYLADGLKDATFSLTWRADYAASQVDATLWGIYSGGALVPFVIKPNGAATSTTNPAYSGNCALQNYSPVTGSVGDQATTPASFQVSGDVARATS
jgi:hypothetical protein